MTEKPEIRVPAPPPPKAAGEVRADRLKAALKANMARRKAQAKARRDDATGRNDDRPDTTE
jgi:hypothetical protein